MDHIIKSAQEYLGIGRNLDFDWKKSIEENGAYVPDIKESYIFIYPVDLLDAMRDDGVLLSGDNIAHRLEISLYRSSENDTALKTGENVWLPMSEHYRPLSVVRSQLEMTQDFKDSLWQKVVVSKIQNQARSLGFCGISAEKKDTVLRFADEVTPGDSRNHCLTQSRCLNYNHV